MNPAPNLIPADVVLTLLALQAKLAGICTEYGATVTLTNGNVTIHARDARPVPDMGRSPDSVWRFDGDETRGAFVSREYRIGDQTLCVFVDAEPAVADVVAG